MLPCLCVVFELCLVPLLCFHVPLLVCHLPSVLCVSCLCCPCHVVTVFISLYFIILFYFDSLVFLCSVSLVLLWGCIHLCVPHVFLLRLLPFCVFKSAVFLCSLSDRLFSSHYVSMPPCFYNDQGVVLCLLCLTFSFS